METLTLYPAPKPKDGTNKAEWTPLRFLKKGEYDLVNISLIGFDPNSGWSYEQCHDAWSSALAKVLEDEKTLRWWMLRKQVKYRLHVAALVQRQGLPY